MARQVRDYYDQFGWRAGQEGTFQGETQLCDLRPAMLEYYYRARVREKWLFAAGGELFVDVGCGGHPARELAEQFRQRLFVDFSAEAVDLVRRELRPGEEVRLGEAAKLPVADGAAAGVACLHVLYHLPPEEQQQALGEIWRILQPGGRALIHTYLHRPPAWRVADEWRQKLRRRLAASGYLNYRWALESDEVTGYRTPAAASAEARLLTFPQTLLWFFEQGIPQRCIEIRCHRLLADRLSRKLLPGGRLGFVVSHALSHLEDHYPNHLVPLSSFVSVILKKD